MEELNLGSNKEIALKETPLEIESANIKVVPYGLKFDGNVSKEEWNKAFLSLQHVNTIYQWYLGDLVAQAEHQWKGEMYDLMMESTGYDYGTLKVFSSTSSTYPPEIRDYIYNEVKSYGGVTKLSYEHFRRAASMMNSHREHAIDFLIRAGKQGWSTRVLIEEITKWKNGGTLPGPMEKPVVEIPDGWEAVKAGKFHGYVPAPEPVGYGDLGEEDNQPCLVQFYKYELLDLKTLLEGNDKYLTVIERIETALEGLE